MKKSICLLLCILGIGMLLAGCVKPSGNPGGREDTSIVEGIVSPPIDVTDVFQVEMCEKIESVEAGGVTVTVQLRNLSQKAMESFYVAFRYYDGSGKVYREEVSEKGAYFKEKTLTGELTPKVDYYFQSRNVRLSVYIHSIDYQDGSTWKNENLDFASENWV